LAWGFEKDGIQHQQPVLRAFKAKSDTFGRGRAKRSLGKEKRNSRWIPSFVDFFHKGKKEEILFSNKKPSEELEKKLGGESNKQRGVQPSIRVSGGRDPSLTEEGGKELD